MAKKRKTFGSKEGTPKDNREDKAMAKKRGMSMAAWEGSAADKKHDSKKRLRKFATGGFMMGQPSTYDPTSGKPPSMGDFSGIFAAGQYNRAKQAYLDNMKQNQQKMNADNAARVAQQKDNYASTLMNMAKNKAYAGGDTTDEDGNVIAGTGYLDKLKTAMNGPGGSRDFQERANNKAYAALQDMPEFKDLGYEGYDFSKQGVTAPMAPAPAAATSTPAATSPAANIVGQRSPQQAAQTAAPAQQAVQDSGKQLQNIIGGVNKGPLPNNKMASPQNQQMKPNRMMRSGGPVKKMASGGAVTRGNGCASRGLTKGRMR